MSESGNQGVGRFAYDGLDRVLHEKARLGILTALVTRPGGVPFTELARLCSLTDGNLSRHLDVLAEAGLVEVKKGYDRRRPLTTCRLTAPSPRPGCPSERDRSPRTPASSRR